MIGMLVLVAIALWGAVGFAVLRCLILPHLSSAVVKTSVILLFTAIWFVGPVLDEILGAREFERLCAEMPSTKFYGPVAVGPGEFFDEAGRPRWKNSDEFSAIKRKSDVWWKQIFDSRHEKRDIRKWPMPVIESHWVIWDRATGKTSIEYFSLYSKGGWLRRLIGIGDYQCPSKGQLVNDEKRIFFNKIK